MAERYGNNKVHPLPVKHAKRCGMKNTRSNLPCSDVPLEYALECNYYGASRRAFGYQAVVAFVSLESRPNAVQKRAVISKDTIEVVLVQIDGQHSLSISAVTTDARQGTAPSR